MAQDNKVVSLKGQRGMDRFTMPATLIRLRDASGQSLKTLLSEFFDGADDALFNMADKAGSNQEQTAYFDAMRELRLRRKSMTLSVLQWLGRAFNELGRFDPLPGNNALENVDQNSLTLMDHGDLEQKVALDNLITKLRNRYSDTIRLLVVRVSHVASGVRLEDRQMPLSPEVICTGLGEACGELDIDIRAKLVVLKLFDKLLISRLELLYQDANRLLVSEGVLPDMKRPPVGHHRSKLGENTTSQDTVSPSHLVNAEGESVGQYESGGSGQGTFSELSALLHRDGSGVSRQSGPAGGRRLNTDVLISRLGEIQAEEFVVNGANTMSLQMQLKRILDSGSGSGAGEVYSVQQVDNDVINLVTMLFDFILEDRQLPPVMKALIARLQIPVLKVALCDRSFFNRGGHPARKLLNELAMAGIGWNEKPVGQRDPLREKIEAVVDRLLNEFTDNVDLFSELLKDFGHFMDLDRRRRELVEQRLKDAEEGRAKQERAKESVDNLVELALTERNVPPAVETLLAGPWRKYLQWVILREGVDSELWQDASDLTGKLIWSVDPVPVGSDTRSELLRAIPTIVDSLRAALHSVSWDPFAIDSVIRDLELAHVDVMQQLVSYSDVRKAPPAEAPVQDVALDAPSSQPPAQSSLSGPDHLIPVSEPVLGALSEISPSLDVVTTEVSTEWLSKAESMRVGSWIEMANGDQKIRCKLAAFIKATGKYIFVNRNGAKVAEYQRDKLAAELASGDMTMLDDGLIFDRALESIIDNLRHSRKD
ncbi:DUF1631 domain-containing protein [Marinobacter sp.]|uniref:DUF1631 domain-containing protein n=1 Tax=Marinobacter sp. TaxID=50741 RepID=UPI0034A043A0